MMSILQCAMPSSKPQPASQQPRAKKAKITHKEAAVLIPVHCGTDHTAFGSTTGHAAGLSKQAEPLGAATSASNELGPSEPNALRDGNEAVQQHMLQAKGLAAHVVLSVKWPPQHMFSEGISHCEVHPLVSLIRQIVATALQYAANGLNVVAVDVQLLERHSACHIICHDPQSTVVRTQT